MAKPTLVISVPVMPNSSVTWKLAHWLCQVHQEFPKLGYHVDHFFQACKAVCSGRNQQARSLLDTKYDAILLVDSDATPDLDGLQHLLDALERDDVDVVGGWSLMSAGGDPGHPCIFSAPVEGGGCNLNYELPARPGLHEITGGALGTHCVAIKRHVFEEFKRRGVMPFEDIFRKDPEDEKWGTRKWGHDVLFFQRAAEFGFRTWVDTRVFWGHVKEVDLRDWFQSRSVLFDEIAANQHVAELLREVWGNTGYTAPAVFLQRMIYEATQLPPDELCIECGSGLTTALLGQVLGPDRLLVLEEDEDWAGQVRLKPGVNGAVHHAPLTDKGAYEWYQLPDMDGRLPVGLVVCDGPRTSTTKGGRRGMLPELYPYLAADFCVLLDDAHRPPEQETVRDWQKSYNVEVQTVPAGAEGRAFAVLQGHKEGNGDG